MIPISALVNPLHAKAEGVFSMNNTVFGGRIVNGYLNATNTSFEVSAYLPDFVNISHTELLLDGDSFAQVITGTQTTEGSYRFLSGTSTPTELQTQISPGGHILSIRKTLSLGVTENEGGLPLIADYSAPGGSISSTYLDDGYLKVGDKIDFMLELSGQDLTKDIADISATYNGKNLSWSPAIPNKYRSIYKVSEGDKDRPNPIQIGNLIIADKAGNKSAPIATFDITIPIDANSPKINIVSPVNNKIYASATTQLQYSSSDPVILVELDSTSIDPDSTSLGPLKDGRHILEITARDKAQNKTTQVVSFSTDTIAPSFSIIIQPGGGTVTQKDKIVFSGISEPGAQIQLEVYSDAQTAATVADADGNWRIEFDSSNLEAGEHTAYLTFTDLVGNHVKSGQISFGVVLPSAAATTATGGTKIALVRAKAVKSDVGAAALCDNGSGTCPVPESDKTEVASNNIISSESQRSTGVNWSAWIILLAIIVLASALATAGYYGYGWAIASSSSSRGSTVLGDEPEDEESEKDEIVNFADTKQEAAKIEPAEPPRDDFDEGPPKTRW